MYILKEKQVIDEQNIDKGQKTIYLYKPIDIYPIRDSTETFWFCFEIGKKEIGNISSKVSIENEKAKVWITSDMINFLYRDPKKFIEISLNSKYSTLNIRKEFINDD